MIAKPRPQNPQPGEPAGLADDRDAGKADPEKDKRIHILVHNPVKDRTEIRVGIRFPGNAPVNQVKNCRYEQRKAAQKNSRRKNRNGADNPGNQGEQRDLVGGDPEPDKDSATGSRYFMNLGRSAVIFITQFMGIQSINSCLSV